MHPFRYLAAILVFLAAPVSFSQEARLPPDARLLADQFRNELADIMISHETRAAELAIDYRRLLDRTMSDLKKAGRTEEYNAVNMESARFQRTPTFPSTTDPMIPPEFVSRITTFREAATANDSEKSRRIVVLAERQLEKLAEAKRRIAQFDAAQAQNVGRAIQNLQTNVIVVAAQHHLSVVRSELTATAIDTPLMLPCTACKETGRLPADCSACQSSGKCKACGGSGSTASKMTGKNIKCLVCKGSGKCKACDGSGKVPGVQPCPSCRGTGKVAVGK